MAIIYKIENITNGKVYIGQTITPLAQRMSKHYSKAKTIENLTGIDAAIKLYGKENFKVEILEECSPEELDEKERYYIQLYDSYNNGYNLTLGGQDGIGSKINIDVDAAYEIYLKEGSIKRAAAIVGCSDKTLSNYFKEYNKNTNVFTEQTRNQNLKKGWDKSKKRVRIIELDKSFESLTECGQWLIDNGYSKASVEHARKGISRVLREERQSYLKIHYEYLD